MRTRNLLVTAMVGAGVVFSAAGGEIVEVKREDDRDGKWNYEAVVKKEGKELMFEVAPDGKFVKKHENKESKEKE
jgi:hypothetical protein